MRIDWSVDQTHVREIFSRVGHTCVTWRGRIVVWGGYSESTPAVKSGAQTKFKEPEHLWIFDPVTERWHVRRSSGQCPPGLSGASSAVIEDKMYVFGGYADTSEGHVDTLYCLDLITCFWSLIEDAKGTPPVASDKSVAWTHDNKLYIFGGYGSPQVDTSVQQLFSRQHNLQFSRDVSSIWSFRRGWNNQFVEYDPANNQWDWPSYSGECPASRAAHSIAMINDDVYIFGGRNNQRRLNDLYCLNMHTRCWRRVIPTLQSSSHNMHHDASESYNQTTSELPPEQCVEGVDLPCCRSWTSFTPLNDNSIVLYGGFSQDEEVLDDCWIFSTSQESWRRMPMPFSKPRIWHTGAPSGPDELIIMGGLSREVSNLTPEEDEKKQLYSDEVLTLAVSPKSLLRLALEKSACVELNSDQVRRLPIDLRRLLRSRKLAKKGILSHGY